MPLFSFGSNGSGQLGIGHVEDVSVPAPCLFDEQASTRSSSTPDRSLPETGIQRIVAGGNHTLVLFANGAVYAAGCNEDGRCGQSPSPDPLFSFRQVIVNDTSTGRSYDTFKGISATWEATFLVPSSGGEEDRDRDAVFVLGSGAKGELGLGPECARAPAATRIPDFPPPGTKIQGIASSMGHTVAVLSNGEVYGWGGARKGQLGGSAVASKIAWSPVKIDNVPFVATGDVACGREFTVVTGDQATGQFAVLGSSGDKWNILSGVPAPSALEGYRGVYASWHGIYVHQKDSSIVCWGRNDRGQLPPVDLPVSREIAVGSEHALALLDDRSVVAFGWGEHGNCGPDTDAQGNVKGEYKRIPLPAEDNSAVVGIGAGCATSWIITSR
ncbi:putative alpha-tubulin suppressor protein Aats1 [Aspergillus steynii IBT 23096]|uniref:Putative alpha-tubulin suppressor protein Aats1 n=1 Tax=Aspergillus steynii IBT 23096 TaxID=1392250 RepID=A0A2I2G567_9EURO|nr:putative alpha-tubulin suppressor protein Aats1 [Aspergillus steynii IBT 23096]PLB48019.1 putative alpha-tubulin suppressor protein Aats1 [Aspergillus steynii IBT 23096]